MYCELFAIFFRHFNNRFSNLESRSHVILYVILIFSAILPIALAIYYNQMMVSEENLAYDYLHDTIISPIRQFIDLAYSKFVSSSVVSDTFTDDLLKSVVSLFVVVNPIGKIPLLIVDVDPTPTMPLSSPQVMR